MHGVGKLQNRKHEYNTVAIGFMDRLAVGVGGDDNAAFTGAVVVPRRAGSCANCPSRRNR